jgi:hypothetical protein
LYNAFSTVKLSVQKKTINSNYYPSSACHSIASTMFLSSL